MAILLLLLPKVTQVSYRSPQCPLWDADWMISPTWCICLFMVSLHTFPWVPSIVHCPKSPISSCISLSFHTPMFGGSRLSSSRGATHGSCCHSLEISSFLLRHFNNFASLSLFCPVLGCFKETVLGQCFSKCDSKTSSIRITRELLRNANSQAPT